MVKKIFNNKKVLILYHLYILWTLCHLMKPFTVIVNKENYIERKMKAE